MGIDKPGAYKLDMRERMAVLVMRCCALLPIRRRRVVFASFSGKAYSDNPRAISEALHDLDPSAQIVWLFKNPAAKAGVIPSYVKTARFNSLAGLVALGTAKAWVDNLPKPLFTRKRKHQYYIQTWHGDRGFKKMLYDAPDHPPGKPVLEQHIADLLVSGSRHCEMTYATGFDYHGALSKFGSPRNDMLMHPDPARVAAIRAKLGLRPGERTLLYAPTMRSAPPKRGEKQQIQPIDLPATIAAFEAHHGADFRCLVRAHSTQIGLSGVPVSDKIQDVSAYEDMADLLLVADALITDYSSSAGDFALTGRPIILFQEDREGFTKTERTFYFDIGASPFVVVTDQAQLEAHIASLTDEAARHNDQAILDFFGAYESGEASMRLAEILRDTMR